MLRTALLAALVLPASWFDWKTRRVPNALTLSFLLSGVLLSAWLEGVHGVMRSIIAASAALALGFLLHLFGIAGGGDGKLLAAIGSIGGLHFLGQTLLWTSLTGLVVSVLVLAWKKALIPFLRRLGRTGYEVLVLQLEPSQSVVEGGGHKIPLAIVISAATLMACLAEANDFRLL